MFFVAERAVTFAELLRWFGEKLQYIGQLEALAAAAADFTCPFSLQDAYVTYYVDNQGALGALVRGCSTEPELDQLAHAMALRHRTRRLRSWFEYVPSAENVADLPSRGLARATEEMLSHAFRRTVVRRTMRLPPGFD